MLRSIEQDILRSRRATENNFVQSFGPAGECIGQRGVIDPHPGYRFSNQVPPEEFPRFFKTRIFHAGCCSFDACTTFLKAAPPINDRGFAL